MSYEFFALQQARSPAWYPANGLSLVISNLPAVPSSQPSHTQKLLPTKALFYNPVYLTFALRYTFFEIERGDY